MHQIWELCASFLWPYYLPMVVYILLFQYMSALFSLTDMRPCIKNIYINEYTNNNTVKKQTQTHYFSYFFLHQRKPKKYDHSYFFNWLLLNQYLELVYFSGYFSSYIHLPNEKFRWNWPPLHMISSKTSILCISLFNRKGQEGK